MVIKKPYLMFRLILQLSCALLRVNNYPILFFSRLLSGIATSFLSTCFECWMVSEHFKQGFAPELLRGTFSTYVLGMGIVAVFSGIVAGFAVERGE